MSHIIRFLESNCLILRVTEGKVDIIIARPGNVNIFSVGLPSTIRKI